jgi:hypothetical protein
MIKPPPKIVCNGRENKTIIVLSLSNDLVQCVVLPAKQ